MAVWTSHLPSVTSNTTHFTPEITLSFGLKINKGRKEKHSDYLCIADWHTCRLGKKGKVAGSIQFSPSARGCGLAPSSSWKMLLSEAREKIQRGVTAKQSVVQIRTNKTQF